MRITPIGTRILLYKFQRPHVKKSNIIIHDEPERDSLMGTIVSIGDGVSIKGINTGDVVKYSDYTAVLVDPDQPNMIIIDEKDVIAVLEI